MLAACNKNDNEYFPLKSVQNKDAHFVKLNQSDPASNPSNPFDYIGLQHNIGLDSLRHYVKVTSDTTRRGMNDYVNRYFKSNFGEDLHLAYNPKEKLICTDFKAIWLTQKVSAAAQVHWQLLCDVPQSIKDLDHYEDFKQQIVNIENRILADKLSADEKKNLLITTSILRYSGYYWINAFKHGEVVEHDLGGGLVMPDSFLRKIAGVITGICADASVVAAGYISGDYAIIGSAFWLSSICGYYTGWW